MAKLKKIPKDKGLDHTLDLLREGYLFIGHRADWYQTNVFQTRLMGKKIICVTGAAGAKMFYNTRLFERSKVMPRRVKETLVGKGGIQGLDGKAHQKRKDFFMNLASEKREKELIKLAEEEWDKTIKSWADKNKQIILYDEAEKILCKAACKWVGLSLSEKEAEEKALQLGDMIFGFGRIGIMHWKGRVSRNELEAWLSDTIQAVREGRLKVKSDTILSEVSHYKDEQGNLLKPQIAAVELLNLLRPIVAIAVYITFMAMALYENPGYKVILGLGEEGDKERFNEEVRRYYPFAPFIGAKVKKSFIWKNYAFKKGTLVLLDLYGTNHDERLWEEPYKFNPNRYKKKKKSPYNFMPQGGGSLKGHRCVGESITMAMMNVALEALVNKISYELPQQDLTYSMTSIPTLPTSGVIMNHIKKVRV